MECIFCLQGNRENNHFPLSLKYCSSIQSTPEQLQRIICITKVCPTCLQDHGPEGPCDDQTQGGNPKQCREDCMLDLKPLCFFTCEHGKVLRTRTKAVSIQVGNNAINVPLLETWHVGNQKVWVQ